MLTLSPRVSPLAPHVQLIIKAVLLMITITGNHAWILLILAFQAAPLEPNPFPSYLASLAQPTITSASLSTHKTGNPALTLTTHVEALAHGINSLSPSPLALHALLITKAVFPTTPWIGNLALVPTIPALVAAPTKTKHSTCFLAHLALALTRPALPKTHWTGRLALTHTTHASVAAHGLPRRPCPSLHACPAPQITHHAWLITQRTGRTASTPKTPALTVAHGLLTIRSLL